MAVFTSHHGFVCHYLSHSRYSPEEFESKSIIQINLSNRLCHIAHSVLSAGPYCLAFLENEAGTERLIAVLLNTVVKARKTMKKTIIEVQGLKKKFKEQEALAGIDFSIREGEIFGFLGLVKRRLSIS